MLLTRPSLATLLALVLAAGFLPAAAQSGSEAVVCVGSERRTLATNPIRRVYTEGMEIVYRIGTDIGQRDQVERDLSSELGSYPEVWCAWSDLADDHAVIISYMGVIRQDLTMDPEDPRFQAFSVGFGTDFDAAEAQATTIDQHSTVPPEAILRRRNEQWLEISPTPMRGDNSTNLRHHPPPRPTVRDSGAGPLIQQPSEKTNV